MPIKTAILGYGRNGSTMHADTVALLPEFVMTAVCDIDPAARRKAADRFGCPVYDDYRRMLEEHALDLVVIVTRSSQHAAMACDCLKRGVNVLVTKPWALHAAQAQTMMDAAAESEALLMPWLPARTASDLRRARELVLSGAIGRVFQIVRCEHSFGLRNDWQTLKDYGGGYLLNWGPHLIDQPLCLADSPVKSVYGYMKQLNNPGDAEDVFTAILRTQSDVLVIAEWSMAEGDLPGWIIKGDRGTILIRGDTLELHEVTLPDEVDDKEYRQRPTVKTTTEKLRDANEFGESVRYGDSAEVYRSVAAALTQNGAYMVAPQSALALTEVLDAVRRSAQTGEVVFL